MNPTCAKCGQKIKPTKPPLDILGDKKILARFSIKYKVDPNSDCWLWQATMDNSYGGFYINSKVYRANRVSWMLYKGSIPPKIYVCHHCDNKLCVNPDHLYLGTPRKNAEDARNRGLIAYTEGEMHGGAKLKEKDIEDIRTASGTSTQLADKYLVSIKTVSDVRLGKTWKHLK